MAKILQLRRGTTAEHSTFTGADGELTVNTTLKLLVLHDGSTVGGFQIPKLVSGKVPFAQLDIQDATTGQKGIVELATQAEVNAGTDNTRAITPDTLNGGIRTHLNATGSPPMYACRAWVNFNGQTKTILGSGNVSSIVSEGGGTYTINFTNAMPDTNYSVVAVANDVGAGAAFAPVSRSLTTTSVRLKAMAGGDNTIFSFSPVLACVAVFR